MDFAPQLLVKQVLGQGIAEKIDSRFRKTEWIPIADALKILKHYGATIEEWGGHFHFAYYDREGVRKRIEDLTWNADDTRNVRLSILNQAVRELKAQQQGVAEGFNGEYDDEAGMAQSNLLTTARAVQGLLDTIKDRDNLPEWAQEKIAKAEMMLVGVWDYLQSQKAMGNDPQVGMEEGRSYYDNRTGFSRGPRDDERHDLDVQQDPREFRMYNLTIDGRPINPQPIMGRSNLIKFGKQQAAAGVDLSNAMISLVDEGLNEFAPGDGGGESGRWYTDDQLTDIVGDGWWQDLDVSGDISKQEMIQQAQAWLDDQGYSVQVLNCKVNDDDMEWFIEGSFQNSGFAKKDVAETDAYMESLAAKLAETITRQN